VVRTQYEATPLPASGMDWGRGAITPRGGMLVPRHWALTLTPALSLRGEGGSVCTLCPRLRTLTYHASRITKYYTRNGHDAASICIGGTLIIAGDLGCGRAGEGEREGDGREAADAVAVVDARG
jgi:hypothetical protein